MHSTHRGRLHDSSRKCKQTGLCANRRLHHLHFPQSAPPCRPSFKSFHIQTLSLLCLCRRSAVHPLLLVPLPPSSSSSFSASLSSQPLCVDSREVPKLVESTAAGKAKTRAGVPALPIPPLLSFHPSVLLSITGFFAPIYLHSVGAVAPIVHRSRDRHNDGGHSVSCQVEILSPGVLAFKHLHQHDVKLHPFQEHPGERCQEEEMQQGRKHRADNLGKRRGGLTHTVRPNTKTLQTVSHCWQFKERPWVLNKIKV